MMRSRRLGSTGLQVSELCFGTGAMARATADPAETAAALALALDLGVNAIEIDAGDLNVVRAIGEVLKRAQAQERVHVLARITSRVRFDLPSPHIAAQDAYPGTHIRSEVEALLAALGVERLAVPQLHAWCAEWLDEGDWLETLGCLRDEGKIAGVGVSLFDHDIAAAPAAIESSAIDCIQAMFNVFEPAAAAMFPMCQRHGIGVVARSPLYFGALAGRAGARPYPSGDWRQAYFYDEHARETAERTARLEAAFAVEGPVADTALRFALTYAAVSTVAIGMRSPAQVQANVNAAAHGPLSAERMRALAEHRWLC